MGPMESNPLSVTLSGPFHSKNGEWNRSIKGTGKAFALFTFRGFIVQQSVFIIIH